MRNKSTANTLNKSFIGQVGNKQTAFSQLCGGCPGAKTSSGVFLTGFLAFLGSLVREIPWRDRRGTQGRAGVLDIYSWGAG